MLLALPQLWLAIPPLLPAASSRWGRGWARRTRQAGSSGQSCPCCEGRACKAWSRLARLSSCFCRVKSRAPNTSMDRGFGYLGLRNHQLDSCEGRAVILGLGGAVCWCTVLTASPVPAEWRPAVMLAAIDCADEANQQVCNNFGITGFPTLKFFRAFSKKAEDAIRITNPSATVEDLRHAIITNLEQSQDAWPPACPPLEPASAEEVHTFFQRNKDQYLALIFEKSDSFVGREVALDMLQYENVAVRRVLSSEEELVEKFGVTTFPSGYLLLRNGSFSRLPVHMEARSFYTYYLRTPSGITRGSYKLNATVDASNETNASQPKRADRSKVYMADLESTLHYSLRVEAARAATLSGAQLLAAFKCYVATLVKYFPGRPCVQTYLQNLDSWLRNWTEPELPRSALKEAMKNNRDASHPAVLPTNVTWVGCQGSEPHFRGYPCGLWTIFHLLTIQAAQSGPDKELPLEVLSTMRCYVRHFFGCQECAQHFEAMAAESMDRVAGREEAVLWLWSHHNEVNARLAGGDTEDPNFPKLQWPPPDMCPQCHREERGVHAWNQPAVLTFLKAHFSPANIHLDYAEADPVPMAREGTGTRLSTEGPRVVREKEEEEEEKETEGEMRAPGRPGSPEPGGVNPIWSLFLDIFTSPRWEARAGRMGKEGGQLRRCPGSESSGSSGPSSLT
uniref:Sulfhydryl oxidase n=1 Tax=Bubo bubo TaxID=30461 RepID=A0A8C0IDU8_BUBBB